jgi:hypothetical protein
MRRIGRITSVFATAWTPQRRDANYRLIHHLGYGMIGACAVWRGRLVEVQLAQTLLRPRPTMPSGPC